MKTCSTCGLEKDDNLFRQNRSQCLECFKKKRAQYRVENKNKIKNDRASYYQNNAEKVRDRSNAYYENNKSKRKLFLIDNKIRLNKKRSSHIQKRYANDPNFRLRKLISGSVLQSLFSKNSSKNGSILEHLSYTIQALKEHIEAQFEPWMTWDNQGRYDINSWDDNDPVTWTWQLDHIIPHSTFHYTAMTDEEFRKCWALENLRPLSAKQNWLDGINRARHLGE